MHVVLRMFGIQLCDRLPRDIQDGPATGDCQGEVNLEWIHGGNMVDDNANGAPVRGRDRRMPFRVGEPFRESRQAGGAFFDASSQRFSTAVRGMTDVFNGAAGGAGTMLFEVVVC